MKNKILIILSSMILIFSIVGCKNKTTNTDDNNESTIDLVINAIEENFDKKNPSDVSFDIKNVKKVTLNGNEVDSKNYTNDNKLVFKASYLSTLNDDYYNFKVESDNQQFVRIYVTGGDSNSYQNVSFYNNKDYRDYGSNEGKSAISEQWLKYGIGDPYIMRFNGIYYLYVPTKDSEMGLKAWKSQDLVNWVPCQGEGLELSYVSMDPITNHAYPIGMFYYDGTFYMSTSPYGAGHYILTSKSPEGPFVAFDNINHKLDIDGRFFVDDDEQVYFVSTADAWLKGIRMTKVNIIGNTMTFTDEVYLTNSVIHPWTEGPDLFKRDGKYYLTFTGSCVVSDGYRISYAVANSYEDFINNNFIEPDNLPLILACDNNDGFDGLGHNGVVMGPDMDSYYVVYHNLNSTSGPNRSLNIDRLLFNGSEMTAIYKNEDSVSPNLPRFYTYSSENGFDINKNYYLSKLTTGESFTAEFNLKGKDVKQILSYKDNENYSYVKVTNGKVSLYKVTNNIEKLIGEGELNKLYDLENNLYTIRVQSNGSRTVVYFNNLEKIDINVSLGSGKIGYYASSSIEIGYTAFSDVSFGESDKIEVKQAGFIITANNYLEDDSYEGINGSYLSDGSGIKEISNKHFSQAYELILKNSFDYVTYPVNFTSNSYYGFEITLNKKYQNTQIALSIDDDVYPINIGELKVTDETEDYVTVIVESMNINEGIKTIKISNWDTKEFGFVQFRFVVIESEPVEKTETLNGTPFLGQDPLVYYFDKNQCTDFTVSFDLMFTETPEGEYGAGLIFRSNNLSLYQTTKHDTEDYTSVQGYFLSLGSEARLDRLNYWTSETIYNCDYSYARGEYFNVKIEAIGNTFKVYIDGELLFEYSDSLGYPCGKVGLYVHGAKVKYQNLVFKNNK